VLALATVTAAVLTLDGESHWFEGVQLLALYVMVGIAAFSSEWADPLPRLGSKSLLHKDLIEACGLARRSFTSRPTAARFRPWSASGRPSTTFRRGARKRRGDRGNRPEGAPVRALRGCGAVGEAGLALVRRLKADAFTGITPVVALVADHHSESVRLWFGAGADEVLTGYFSPEEQLARVEAMRVRTERDVAVHPSTRLPGTTEIEREIRRQLDARSEFAVCYADLDHFKEYNDRYSYYDGDRVIYLLSRLLHDVVKGSLGPRGFVGHIGGDDFIFIIPAAEIGPVCTEIVGVFDTLIRCSTMNRIGVPGTSSARTAGDSCIGCR